MRVARWFFRVCAVAILVVQWLILPALMPGPSRLLTLVHFLGMVIAFDFAFIVFVMTFVPVGKQARHQQRRADNEMMRKHVAHVTATGADREGK